MGLCFLRKKSIIRPISEKRKAYMNASKVIITPETREKLNNPVLSPLKKRQLREEMIKDSIRKAVGGVRTKQELVAAAGFNPSGTTNDYANGLGLITSMIKRGIINHNPTSSFKKVWSVTEDVKVTPSPKKVAQEIVAPVETKPELTVEERPKVQVNKGTLLNLAKEFAWKNNSDSLREFIVYAENRLK